MTQSLHQQDSSDDGAPMQRSASFHYENARAGRGLLYPIHQLTSEDDESEDYGSGCDSSQVFFIKSVRIVILQPGFSEVAQRLKLSPLLKTTKIAFSSTYGLAFQTSFSRCLMWLHLNLLLNQRLRENGNAVSHDFYGLKINFSCHLLKVLPKNINRSANYLTVGIEVKY